MGDETLTKVRVDVWTWAVRLFKTRSLATKACQGGHVEINDEHAKPASPVKVGDKVRIRGEGRERLVEVTGLLVKRVGAEIAATCLVDMSPPPPDRIYNGPVAVRDRGTGRPTKRERRDLDRLRGR